MTGKLPAYYFYSYHTSVDSNLFHVLYSNITGRLDLQKRLENSHVPSSVSLSCPLITSIKLLMIRHHQKVYARPQICGFFPVLVLIVNKGKSEEMMAEL
jgi:hypothetical protein